MADAYDKLVRDDIPRIIEESGERPVVHVAEGEAYERRLFEKFEEEFGEFRADRSLEELADILEVVHAFCVHEGWSLEELERRRQEKADERVDSRTASCWNGWFRKTKMLNPITVMVAKPDSQ